jgi:hypothetical protein
MKRPVELKYKIIIIGNWNCKVLLGNYVQGGYSIILVDAFDGASVATATRWLPGIPENAVVIDSNNLGHYMIEEKLIEGGIIKKELIGTMKSGFCDYPIYYLTEEVLKEFELA